MSKLPWMQFCTGDWLKDPELRSVSSGARGLWIDMLSFMWEGARRGYLKLNNGKIVTAEILARMTGNSTDDTSLWLQELADSGVSSHTDDVCIYSRSMLKDEQKRSGTRERVAKHRSNTTVTQDVTPSSVSVSVTDVDVGSQFLEKEDLMPPENLDELVRQIAKLHPRNWREKGSGSILIPQADEDAIASAIVRDGIDLVLAGTKNYADAVSRWPIEGRHRTVKRVEPFYNQSDYNKNPKEWEQSNGQVSKGSERSNRNREVAKSALERRYGNADVGPSGSSDGVQGDERPGTRLLAGIARKVSAGSD